MATSESEDFESADEEFEMAQSVKQKGIDKNESTVSKEDCKRKAPLKTIVSDKDDSTVPLSADKLSSKSENLVEGGNYDDTKVVKENPNSTSPSDSSASNETIKNEVVKASNRRMTNLEKQAQKSEVKQKSSSKKLGMKLSNNKIVKNKDNDEFPKTNLDKQIPTDFKKGVIDDPRVTELLEAENLELSLKSESLKESSFKSDTTSNLGLKSSNDSNVESSSAKILESKPIKHSSGESMSDKESSPELNVISKSASGDGWEVEEEDGFEVPVSLSTKPKNEVIQSEREISPVLERLSATASEAESKVQGWGSWGGWGVTSLLSTATESVSSFSSHVTTGISTVLESSLGVPDPEELAKRVVQEEKEKELSSASKPEELVTKSADVDKTEGLGFSGLGSLMSGVGFLGTKVLSGGLDTLETLGKKTMEVLQEGDPLLRKKRAMLFHDPDKPVLSQILKEAKEKAENNDKEQAEKVATRKAHFETLFDDYQGLVHLEALEMLSKQCQLKLQSILLSYSGSTLLDLQETLSEVKELCELPEDEDDEEVLTKEEFEKKITDCVKSLHPNLSPSKIIQVYDAIENQLKELGCEKVPAVDIHQKAISSMAEFTACTMECFHKGAELVLTKSHRSTADEAENFVILTTTFCGQVSSIARDFTCLLTKFDPIANSAYITNIFLEAGNSASYIQNACQLLLPVIQAGAAS